MQQQCQSAAFSSCLRLVCNARSDVVRVSRGGLCVQIAPGLSYAASSSCNLVYCSVQVQQCVICLASRSVCLSLGACFDHTQLDTHSTPSRIAIGHLISMSTLAEPTSVHCICWGTHTQVQSMLQSVILPAPLSCCERKGTKDYYLRLPKLKTSKRIPLMQ